jgi:hypothetical protein
VYVDIDPWHGVIPGDQAAYLSFLLDAYVDCEMDDGKIASFKDVARVIEDTADSLEVLYLPQRCAWLPPWAAVVLPLCPAFILSRDCQAACDPLMTRPLMYCRFRFLCRKCQVACDETVDDLT